MGYDERCFTAALVGLAVKGWARIQDKDGTYTVSPSNTRRTPLGPGERRINTALLGGSSIELLQKNHSKIRSAISGLREALKLEYDGKMFRRQPPVVHSGHRRLFARRAGRRIFRSVR
jgi:hypothetical protein